MIFYEENFSSKIKIIDSSFIELVYSFHSAYQEREIGPSMKTDKSVDDMRVKTAYFKQQGQYGAIHILSIL